MRTAHSRSGLWAIGAGSAVVLFILCGPAVHGTGSVYVLDTTLHLLRAAQAAIAEGYRVAPALMLGLGLSIGFPLLVIASRVIRRGGGSPDVTRLYRRGRVDVDDDVEAEQAEVDAVPHTELPFVEIEAGGKGMRRVIVGDMLRIGREDDNDIRIPSGAVHRYHAAIYREDYDDWHITDLSGVEGQGLIVNGRRCCEARLNDGDLIQLGPGKLRFRAGSV